MGMIHLSGRLVCPDLAASETLARALPEHIRLTRDEPGCLSFDVTPTDDPLVWQVAERFIGRSAFEAHQARTMASGFAAATAAIARHYTITEGD